MGYSITIGEKVESSSYEDIYNDYIEDGETEEEAREHAECWRYGAKSERHDKAPAFGEPTDYTNDRWPSYTSWYEFCESAGLIDLLYDDEKRSLRGGHPGYFHITKHFVQRINAHYKMFKIKYPDATATYDESHNNAGQVCFPFRADQNGVRVRFEWLVYWVDYAFNEYGEDAIIYNS